jgi:hypothetical protein
LKYLFDSILVAASLAVLPEIGLARGGAGGGGHGFGGGGGGHVFVGNGATVSADSTAAALVRDSGEREAFLLVAFPVAEIKVVLATVVSVDASAPFAGVAFARLMEAFSISASMGMDFRIITHTTTRITIRTLTRLPDDRWELFLTMTISFAFLLGLYSDLLVCRSSD